MLHHLAGIVVGTMNEARFSPPQHGESERVETWCVDDAAVVAKLTFGVHYRHLTPVRAAAAFNQEKL